MLPEPPPPPEGQGTGLFLPCIAHTFSHTGETRAFSHDGRAGCSAPPIPC